MLGIQSTFQALKMWVSCETIVSSSSFGNFLTSSNRHFPQITLKLPEFTDFLRMSSKQKTNKIATVHTMLFISGCMQFSMTHRHGDLHSKVISRMIALIWEWKVKICTSWNDIVYSISQKWHVQETTTCLNPQIFLSVCDFHSTLFSTPTDRFKEHSQGFWL